MIPPMVSVAPGGPFGVERFPMQLGKKNVIVGPNDTGKSTLLDAIRGDLMKQSDSAEARTVLTINLDDSRDPLAFLSGLGADAHEEVVRTQDTLLDNAFALIPAELRRSEYTGVHLDEARGLLALVNRDQRLDNWDVLASGLRTWLVAAFRIAVHRMVNTGRPTVYLIDEPELHLHESVRAPLVRHVLTLADDHEESILVVVTHARQFLGRGIFAGWSLENASQPAPGLGCPVYF